jgi:hypothetical protein
LIGQPHGVHLSHQPLRTITSITICIGLTQTVWPYLRRVLGTPYYPVPYMTLSHRFRNRMTVYGFWPTVYTRRMYGLDCIYAVYGPYLQVVQGSNPSNSSLFCSFWLSSFLAPLLTELFLCFPFLLMHVFCMINCSIGGNGSWTPFCTEKATFWSFWLEAGLAPQPFIFW